MQQAGEEKPRRQSLATGQQSQLEPSVVSPANGQGDSNGSFNQARDSNIISPPPFAGSHMENISHMSMPETALNHVRYDMSSNQHDTITHMAAHTYGQSDYSPMQDFPTDHMSRHMSSQVYDPQLVAMDRQMSSNDMIPEAFNPPTNRSTFGDQAPDMLQFWLSQADDNFGYSALESADPPTNDIYVSVGEDRSMPLPPPRTEAISEVSDASSTSNIPDERFARVESCWLSETGKKQRFGPTIWDEIFASSGPNLFTSPQSNSQPPALSSSDSRWGIGAELKQRLEMEFGMAPSHVSSEQARDSFPRPKNLGVPPPEVLEICLDAYFRRFHPLAPFVHVSTFRASSAPLPLLYAMCLLGLSAVKQNVGGNYIKHAFKTLLRKVMIDLAMDATTTTVSVTRKLSTYAAGCLTLNLAALSGDQDQIAQAQALHASLLSSAQKRGLFSVDEVRLDVSFATSTSEAERWQGWSRMESAKRLTVCLLTCDWWFSAYNSTGPIVRPEGIQICVPSDNMLFKAESDSRWAQLMETGKYKLTFPLLRPRTYNLEGALDSLICLDPPLHAYGQYTLLSIIKLCQCDTQHRHFLITDDWEREDHLVPWQAFSDDTRGRSLVPMTVSLASIITATPKTTDLNALILWHNICMTLNANVQIFELAAGRGGAAPASKALANITKWTQTSSARRACVHAAQIFKLLHHRKVSDPISINALTALFYAGLVLGLYFFMVPASTEGMANKDLAYDLLDDVDWILVGDAGMTEDTTPGNSPGTGFESAKSSEPAVAFIENGGPVSMGDVAANGGYMSARRTFLDFAHLMDEMGTWRPKALSKILHIMSDVLEEPN